MMLFFLGVVSLTAASIGLLVLTRARRPRATDFKDPNLQWLHLRQNELEGQSAALRDEAALRVLSEGIDEAAAMGIGGEQEQDREQKPSEQADRFSHSEKHDPRGFWRLLLIVGLALITVPLLIYQQIGSIDDVLIAEDLVALGSGEAEIERASLIRRIQARSEQRQDNLAYLNLLGRIYMADEDYAAAQESFSILAAKAPESPDALAMAAQASFLAAGRRLDPQAQLSAEKALAIDPEQRTALGLLGMAAFERGAFSGAIEYWTRLQQQEAPGSNEYQMLANVIQVAKEQAGEVPAGSMEDADPPGVDVEVVLDDGLQAEAEAVVYIFARSIGSSAGPPIAVVRLKGTDLPARLRLTDGDSMAGQKLSDADVVRVFAQLSKNGKPGDANSLYSGVSANTQVGVNDSVARIILRPTSDRPTG
ncbi:MAG: tetratricopeptide repeat protein [Pseudomonadota bacterium]